MDKRRALTGGQKNGLWQVRRDGLSHMGKMECSENSRISCAPTWMPRPSFTSRSAAETGFSSSLGVEEKGVDWSLREGRRPPHSESKQVQL